MNYIDIGKFISKLRKDKKLTQEELALLLNVNSKTISKWENGFNVPDTIYLYELSNIFNISIEELLNGKRNVSKRINFKILILLVIVISIFTYFIIYIHNNYNKINITMINSNDKLYSIDGYYIESPKLSYFYIKNIDYLFDKDIFINSYDITIFANDEFYYSIKDNNINTTLSDVLKTININYKSLSRRIDNFKIYISYTDYNNIDYIDKVNLITKNIYSNNKFKY